MTTRTPRLIKIVIALLAAAVSLALTLSSINATTTWWILKLPDTGQTTSYTDVVGEDADYSINPPIRTMARP
jgi:hypothetical protein